jgi:hypothetical protein
MPDLALLATVLTSIKAATEIAKGLREADISLEKAELKLKLADLMTALADARIAVSSVQEDLLTKDRQIKELRESLDLKKVMKYQAPFYWHDEGGRQDGPFCQQCYDSAQKAIRLQDLKNSCWRCNTCGNVYDPGGSRQRQVRAVTDFDPRDP